MSALVLRVERGVQSGAEYVFEESDDVIIGRDVPESQAHLRLDPGDRTVSRLHCMLEVRPPNGVLLRDLGSKHGTQLRRHGSDTWNAVRGTRQVHDGDRIRVGATVLVLALTPTPAPEPAVLCIRCQEPIVTPTRGATFVMQASDYLCPRCRAEESAAVAGVVSGVECDGCCADVTSLASSDGRADELRDVVTYLCPACAERGRELMRQQVGPFLLLSQVGAGAMGVVYQVWDTRSGRVLALKQVLRPLHLPPATLARFLREIALLQQLRHPGITRFVEAGQDDHVPYFVSEFVPDGNLAPFVSPQGRPVLPIPAAVRLVSLALAGVAHAHAAGIVHRDLKPENILLSRGETAIVPKVADFGLSRSYQRHGGTVTVPGEFAGTLHYLPPEQVQNFARCGPPADVYAMGSCLYYLLTGRHPLHLPESWELEGHEHTVRGEYRGLTDEEVLRRVLHDERIPVRERRPDVPASLAAVVDRAVARDADRRPVSADQMRTLLDQAVRMPDG